MKRQAWVVVLLATACGGETDQNQLEVTAPLSEGDAVFAVDVSHWSETVAATEVDCWWDRGIRHVIAGTQDRRIARQQLDRAIQGGMTVDAYVYLHWDQDVTTQVEEALATVEDRPIGRLWLDVEESAGGYSAAALEAMIQEGLDACGQTACGIYTGAWWWNRYLPGSTAFADRDLWYALYDGEPSMDTWTRDRFGGWTTPFGKQWNDTYECGVNVDQNTMIADHAPTVVVDRTPPPDDGQPPPAPSGLYPDGLTIPADQRVRPMCDSILGATRYQIAVEHEGSSGWLSYYTWSVSESAIGFWPILDDRVYRFRVRAENAHGFGPWSGWAYFGYGDATPPAPMPQEPPPEEPPPVEPPPEEPPPETPEDPAGAPTGVAPEDGTYVTSNSVTLESTVVDGAEGYVFEIEYDSAGTYRHYFTYDADRNRRTFWPVVHGVTYRWRVKARTADGETPFSAYRTFDFD